MKPITYILSFLFLQYALSTTARIPGSICQVMHQGTFTYGAPGSEILVEIKGNKHIEYHQGGKYTIESEIDWVSDCEYTMTMLKISIPDFPYKPGDVMNVTIDRVAGNEIFYTSTVKGQSWKGKFTKIK